MSHTARQYPGLGRGEHGADPPKLGSIEERVICPSYLPDESYRNNEQTTTATTTAPVKLYVVAIAWPASAAGSAPTDRRPDRA